MAENVGYLQELEARMSRLIESRNAIIDAAEDMIDAANQEFDEAAIPLGREIAAVRDALVAASKPSKSEKPKRTRRKKDPEMTGLTEAEKEMYRRLLGGTAKSNR